MLDIVRTITTLRRLETQAGAAVNTFGCKAIHDSIQSEQDRPFLTLIALLLSSQTRDQLNYTTVHRLYEKGLKQPQDFLNVSERDLEDLLYPVSFYRRKAQNIKAISSMLETVPDTFEGLTALPGIGPKMAHLVLQILFDKTEGISVDTHVHRVSNRIGWAHSRTPEETRTQLEALLPRHLQIGNKKVDVWRDINPLLVAFGQTVCLPQRPRCGECPFSSECPSAFHFGKHQEKSSQGHELSIPSPKRLRVRHKQ